MKSHRGRKDQVFLKDPATLNRIGSLLRAYPSPVLQIGPGEGAIFKTLPSPRFAVEVDPRFSAHLAGETVLWGDFLSQTQFLGIKTVVGNLPFANSIAFILHAKKVCPDAHNFFFIVQREVGEKIMGPGKLGFVLRQAFTTQRLWVIPGSKFDPTVGVDALFIHLRPKDVPHETVRAIELAVKKIISPRKILKMYYPLLPVTLAKKRIDQLTVREEDELQDWLLNNLGVAD